MIEARKGRRFSAWFARQVEKRLLRTFGHVWQRGLGGLAAASEAGPVLLVGNHATWWDALVAIQVCHRALSLDGYAMMDAANLRALPFLGRVGGFGVEVGSLGDGMRAICYSCGLLSGPGRVVLVYPQGEERPVNARPLGFRRGSGLIAARAREARVVAMATRCVFGPHERPDVYVALGTPQESLAGVDAEVARQEAAVVAELERIEEALEVGPEAAGFEAMLSSPKGLTSWFAERALIAAVRAQGRLEGR